MPPLTLVDDVHVTLTDTVAQTFGSELISALKTFI